MKALKGQDAQMQGSVRGLFNCSNGIIVYYSKHYRYSIHPVVPSTISLRLAEVLLHSQWSLRRLPLTQQHRRNHLTWGHSQSSYLPSDWHRIVFSEETRFSLEADEHHLCDWRSQGQRSQESMFCEVISTIPHGVKVWVLSHVKAGHL
ncbi:transposable element Tc1 transposase [Trichonephila clavipes]|nr:transposable element Tc1 transposase [Trichonephila clavipes]